MGNICVIGPRSSGKTTYLAALTNFNESQKKSRSYKIKGMNDDAKKLAQAAENIIRQGLSFEQTIIDNLLITSVDDLPYYAFDIQVKKSFFSPWESINLNLRDYPGEVFEKIIQIDRSDRIFQEFIEECLMKDVVGCLILLTEWERKADKFYKDIMDSFIDLMVEYDRLQDLRIAVAMSKCERGEIWPGRIEPEIDLFGVYLAKTRQVLRDRIPAKNLRFYAMSTFGVLQRDDPRPNRIDIQGEGKASVLREPSSWQPYNTIDPLYWLQTGKG